MPSASMYSNPYTHKEPPPKINYPPMFSGLATCFSLRYILDSKLLALVTLILAIALFVTLLMIIMPFWFELKFDEKDGTFGRKPTKTLTINSGIFFFDEDHFTNLMFLNKYTNEDVVPKALAFAQVCSVLGMCTLVCCFAGATMLLFRRFASATGTVFLAGGTTLTAVLHLASIISIGVMLGSSDCSPGDDCYRDNLAWRMLPLHSQMYRVEPYTTPQVNPGWAFFIAAIGCLLVLGSAVMMWIEALMTMNNLTGIRYQQLRETRDPYANDVNPADGKKYVYAPPQRLGTHTYGMQPVVYGMPSMGFVQGPSQPAYRYDSETGSSVPPTREIDL